MGVTLVRGPILLDGRCWHSLTSFLSAYLLAAVLLVACVGITPR